MQSRFAVAMGSYALLALLAGFSLTGKIRGAVWILLGGLAAKTMIVVLSRRKED